MDVPAYSIFSAASELLVTAAVFYVLWKGWRGDFRRGLLVCVLLFEAFVNVSYMVYRSLVPSPGLSGAPAWLGSVAALHGLLSLAMFLFLLFITALAWRDSERGGNFFRETPATTFAFAGLWTLSVASGEFLFVALYLA